MHKYLFIYDKNIFKKYLCVSRCRLMPICKPAVIVYKLINMMFF